MKSLRFLYEMFMPEARFPDEKFWDKDGDPIQADPKGPPKDTIGKTQADYRAKYTPIVPNAQYTIKIPWYWQDSDIEEFRGTLNRSGVKHTDPTPGGDFNGSEIEILSGDPKSYGPDMQYQFAKDLFKKMDDKIAEETK